MSRQIIIYLRMARNWLLLPVSWIEINIMLCAVSVQNAARRHKLANQFAALHTAISFT